MIKEKQVKPRLVSSLTVLLILQAPLLIFLGLNLLTARWEFLMSWQQFWAELKDAYFLIIDTPGVFARDEVLFYDALAFATLLLSAGLALVAGLTFYRGRSVTLMIGLMAQIGTLISGLGLYFLQRPPQAYWLLAMGIIMVLYLNYREVYQWFLKDTTEIDGDLHA
jgi:hypothetical protein